MVSSDELGVQLGRVDRGVRRPRPPPGRGQLLGRRGPARLVAGGLGRACAIEQLDLAELAVEPRPPRSAMPSSQVGGQAGAGDRLGRSRGVGRSAIGGDQSSGIRIQPWRIAYTTAWVRSLTDSLRRMELMWFLTVCSLIDSA